MEQLKSYPFALIGVNNDDELERLKTVVAEKNLNWRSFWDGDEGKIVEDWNVTRFPTTYVLDSKGVIRYIDPCGSALDHAIKTLLAEVGHNIKIKFDHLNTEAESKKETKKSAKAGKPVPN